MTANDFCIRAMTEDDLAAVTALEKALFSDPWPKKLFQEEISSSSGHCFVAQKDNEVAGYIMMIVDGGYGHLTNLAIARRFQRKSIAKKLLSYILELAAETGLEWLSLEVRLSNQAAQALYQSVGFEVLNVLKDHYTHPKEDGLIMIRPVRRMEHPE